MTDGFIKKIHKLKNCGVFREWPQNFEFGRYTLIYGWNGTGKTTFSRLMRSIEKEKVDPALEKNIDHEFQFKLHDDTILESNALIGWKNKIRVFNVDFVRENINSDNAEASPVYHLGKDQGEALAALQKVNDELTKRREEQATIKTQIDQNEKGKAKFLTKNASIIKDASSQANFDSPKLAKIFSEYKEETHDSSKYILSDDSLKAAIATAAGVNGKDRLFNLSFTSILDASKFHEKMGHTLENCISKTAIAELDNDADLKNWVERGQVLHKGKKICGFCTNEITQSRIEALESYFNEAYKNLQKTIDALTLQLSGEIAAANSVKIIDAANFYPETQLAYQEKSTKFDDARKKYIASLKNCLNTLTNKKENLTTKLPVPNLSDLTSPATTLSAALAELNKVFDTHNDQFDNFQIHANESKKKVSYHHAAKMFADFCIFDSEIESLQKQVAPIDASINALDAQRMGFESKLKTHEEAANRINELLEAFIGRNDIKLLSNDKGYIIQRNGEQAVNLSEGEKTAVAFTYFISKMEERDFNIEESIIVVDDPISSLDSNALYSAGAFIRCHLEKAKQIFILTHNYQFFREIFGWISGIQKTMNPGGGLCFKSYLMLKCEHDQHGNRMSIPAKIDEMLEKYDSEYVFLCNQLFNARGKVKYSTNPDADQLAKLIVLPNVGRKVLESFLLFKFPNIARNSNINLFNQMKPLGIDMGIEKISVIDRLLNRGSHGDETTVTTIKMPDMAETPKIVDYVLEFIEKCDKIHYDQLCEVLGVVQPSTTQESSIAKAG